MGPYRKQPGHIAQLVGLQSVDEGILLAEALLKQLLVGAVDVAEPLAQMTVVTATGQYTCFMLIYKAVYLCVIL